jgi:XapX domain-containing protein
MNGFSISLLMGLVVGVAYGLCGVRSPAPPLVALVGLLGMVLGEQAVALAKTHYFVAQNSHQATADTMSDVGAGKEFDQK